MLRLIFLSSPYGSHLFWVKALVVLCLLITVCLIFKFRLRRFEFKRNDLKTAGLNHRQRRQWLAKRKKKNKSNKRHF